MLRTCLAGVLLSTLGLAQSPLGGDLPVIGTVGDVPEGAFAIELHHNGMLSIDGIPRTFEESRELLRRAAGKRPGDKVGPVATSDLPVLIRAAGAVPVATIERMLWTCASHGVHAPKVFFGAQHPDGSEGAFAYFLPIDSGEAGGDAEVLPITVKNDDRGDVAGLQNYVQRFVAAMAPEQRAATTALLQVDGDLRWDRTLQMLDACRRAGIVTTLLEVQLTGDQQRSWTAPATRNDLRALAAASPAHDDVGCRIGPMAVRAGKQAAAPARVRGAIAGFTQAPRHLPAVVEEIEEPVIEEPVEGGRAGGKFVPRGQRSVRASAESQAIRDGLSWLARHQDRDGKWDCDQFMKHDAGPEACDGPGNAVHDVGATGLALLALLGDGNTLRSGRYKDNVKMAVKWLREQQQQNGLIGVAASHDFVYDHAIATLAIVEAYGLSNYRLIRANAQQAIDYLERHRNPYAVWRYQPRDNDNDVSVTSWCVAAYRAANDFGLEVNDKALQLAATYYDQVCDPATGKHGYTRRGEGSSRMPGDHAVRFPIDKNEGLTGAALFARFLLGQEPKTKPVMDKAAALLASKPPSWSPKGGNIDFYAWYWSSLALYQTGGQHWQHWAEPMRKALMKGQAQHGPAAGSWDPVGVWCDAGGRIYSTALATLTLQTYYRYGMLVK